MKRLLMLLFVGLMVVGFSCQAADIDMSHFLARQVRVDGHSYAYRVFCRPAGTASGTGRSFCFCMAAASAAVTIERR
jgi:hypothetical protein